MKEGPRAGMSLPFLRPPFSNKENKSLKYTMASGEHLLRRHFGDWADIKLYQVLDMSQVSGEGSNKYGKKAIKRGRWGRVALNLRASTWSIQGCIL